MNKLSTQAATLLALTVTLLFAAPTLAAQTAVSLYHNPGCMCCEQYAAYLGQSGYQVDVINADGMATFNRAHSVPRSLASCHTMLIGDYVVVGHVPAPVVNKLLRQQPDIRGIALAGMPLGSPGMGGQKSASFVIHTLDDAVYTTY